MSGREYNRINRVVNLMYMGSYGALKSRCHTCCGRGYVAKGE